MSRLFSGSSKDVVRVLGEGHGNQCALSLLAGERVDVGVTQYGEVKEVGEGLLMMSRSCANGRPRW